MADLREHFAPPVDDTPLMTVCPYHDDNRPSLAIFPDHVYCFACGAFRWPEAFLQTLGDKPVRSSVVRATRRQKRTIDPQVLAGTFASWLHQFFPTKLAWLHSRGLRSSIALNQVGYTGSAYSIPVYDREGTVQSIRYRRDDATTIDDQETPKYWGTPGANQVALYLPSNRVREIAPFVLCEGEFDALALSEHGLRTGSLTNGCRAFKVEHGSLLPDGLVYVAYDQDAAGLAGAVRIAHLLGKERVRLMFWGADNGKDVSELLRRPNGIGIFNTALKEAK